MGVEVRYYLAGVQPDVGEHTVALAHEPGVARDLADRADKAGDLRVRRPLRKIVPRDVRSLGDHQYVRRRERVDVVQGERIFVLVDRLRRDLPAQDAGEDVA